MPTYVMGPDDLPGFLVEDAEGRFETVVETLRREAKLRAPLVVQRLVDGEHPPPVDRGTYRRSFHVADVEGGVSVYNDAPHAPVIEGGRRPGSRMPPVDVIAEWVRRKGIGDQLVGPVQASYGPRQKGKRQKSDRARAVEEQQRGIALQIARKIAARGLPAHHILRRMDRELRPLLIAAIGAALDRGRRE